MTLLLKSVAEDFANPIVQNKPRRHNWLSSPGPLAEAHLARLPRHRI